MKNCKNVKDLIEELEKIEDKENIAVVLQGCDCIAEWNGKLKIIDDDEREYEPYNKFILIKRDI